MQDPADREVHEETVVPATRATAVFVRATRHKPNREIGICRDFYATTLSHVWAMARNPASDQATDYAYVQVLREAGATGLEPATSGVTGRRSNQLNYAPGSA